MFYKHSAPLALGDQRVCQQYQLSPLFVRVLQTKSGDKSPHSKDSVNSRTVIILQIVDAIEV
jgi:hypothetical protein